jgi:hypothetical protein
MNEEEVIEKEYKMVVEYNYWTEKDNVPDDDPHWFTIDILTPDNVISPVTNHVVNQI